MKKVIDGLLYDTDASDLILSRKIGCGQGNFNMFDEGLYRTRRGRWFLASEGPANIGGAEQDVVVGIVPITAEQALELCERAGIDSGSTYYEHLKHIEIGDA